LYDIGLPSFGQPQFVDFDRHESAIVWRDAIERLRADASTPLPI
jgi:hypothetical protein